MAKNNTFTFRQLFNKLHLWLGIISSIVLFIVCITGTIYVFKTEIEEFIEPNKYQIEVSESALAIENIINILEDKTQGNVSRVVISDRTNRPFELNVKMDKEDRRGSNFMVNQYTGEVLGNTKGPASGFFLTVFKLHRWLLLDIETGRPIVGIATLIFIFMCISGLIIWFPKKIKGWKSLKPGFKIMWRAKWKRVNHDLHSTLGFYSLIFLLIMGLTGLTWSFEWYNTAFHKTLTGKVREKNKPQQKDSENGEAIIPALSYEEAIDIANVSLPYKGKTIISKFSAQSQHYEVIKYNSSKFNVEASDKVKIDPIHGEIIQAELFDDLHLGEKISKQFKGLHMGTTYGLFSKIIYFIVCLIASSLPISGILIWYNKLRN